MTLGIESEFAGAKLGDKRLEQRLLFVANRFYEAPSASIPEAMQTNMALEGTYRFLRNENVTPEAILAPHIAATSARVARAGLCVVAHDTSHFCFPTERDGLGRGSNGKVDGRVFFGHVALAVTLDGMRTPLGVLALETFARKRPIPKSRKAKKKPESLFETGRWGRVVTQAEKQLDNPSQVIHVMDREADQYQLLARLIKNSHRFVVRVCYDRAITREHSMPGRPTIKHAIEPLAGRFTRQVLLTAKDPKPLAKRRGHKKRTREATLQFDAVSVEILLPETAIDTTANLPTSLSVNIVHVIETDVPDGYSPVEWKLVTTEPIETVSDIETIVDAYRARWAIEEYFKALKTGCAMEKRQLESTKTIYNAFAVFVPIAWSLFRLRHLAREAPDTPAKQVLSDRQIKLLQRHPNVKLGDNPTSQESCLAIASLGGHIKYNGPPGWIVLGRGYEKLLQVEIGAQLAGMT